MISFPFTYKKKGLKVEFNWDKKVVPCKKVRITLGTKRVTLTREEFATMMAVFADENQLEDMIQVNKEDFVSIERMLKIKTNKDLKEGEYLVFPYTHWLPKSKYEELKKDGEMIKLVEKSTKDIKEFVSDNEAAKNMKTMWEKGKLELSTS